MSSCAMFYMNMGMILYITRHAECRHNSICLVIFPIRNVVVI